MKKRTLLSKKLEIFYKDIEPKREKINNDKKKKKKKKNGDKKIYLN